MEIIYNIYFVEKYLVVFVFFKDIFDLKNFMDILLYFYILDLLLIKNLLEM